MAFPETRFAVASVAGMAPAPGPSCEVALGWWRQALFLRGLERAYSVRKGFNALLSACSAFSAARLDARPCRVGSGDDEQVAFPTSGSPIAHDMVSLLEEILTFVDPHHVDDGIMGPRAEPQDLRRVIDRYMELDGRWQMQFEAHRLATWEA